MTFDFLIFQHYDYNLISDQLFDSIIMQATMFFGILSNIVFAPFYLSAPKVAEKQYNKQYPDEKVLHVVKNPVISRFIVFFILGAFVAMCIYPFIAFDNLISYGKVHKIFFWPYIIFYLIVMHGVLFFRYSMTYIISDKGIRLLLPYKFSNIYKGKYYGTLLPYNIISSTKIERMFTTDFLNIYLKKGCLYLNKDSFGGLCAFSNLKKVKVIIDSRIEKENTKNEQ